ncbi:MAG: hypothetical protein ACR2OO_02645 [Thermomicrobiales bacterium]
MSGVVTLSLGVLGLFVGSAIWTIARNQARRKPLAPVAYCDAGDGAMPGLAWLPFLGFGSARVCPTGRAPQSRWRIPFELATAAYFMIAAGRIDDRLALAALLVFSIPLSIIFLVDSWTRLIHTNVIGLGIVAGLAFAVASGTGQIMRSVLGMAAAAAAFGGLFLLAAVVYRNVKIVPFGLGDVYLAAMIGSMVRVGAVAQALLYGIMLSGVCIVVLLLLKRVNRRQAVAYGPYLCLGALLSLVLA